MSSAKGSMIVGVDGSPASLRALEWAAKNALGLNCTIEVISTWEPYIPSGELVGSGMAPSLILPNLDPEQIADEVIENCIKEVFGNARPEHLISRTLMGDPGQVLVSESENATLVVVGSRGHGKFHDLVLGSVSSTCAAKAKCPVVVVHAS
ncbi:MAG: universal stress protein [Actinobacteria bacterium]|nr:universal stress protein [Actinomycetota bacterium]